MIAGIGPKSLALALMASETSQAFTATSMARKTTASFRRGVGTFMAAGDESEQDGIRLKTVLSKEIYFDGEKGRFFETKSGTEGDEKSDEVSGPFAENQNPFKKPEGTFFQELFAKNDEAATPVKVAPPAEASAPTSLFSNPFEKEETEPVVAKVVAPEETVPTSLFDKILQKKENEPVATTAVAPTKTSSTPVSTPKPSTPSFFDNFLKPKKQVVEAEPELVGFDPVTVSPDFRVAALFLLSGFLLDNIPIIQFTLGPIVTLLGLLFFVQSVRVRFLFNENNEFEVATIKNFLTGELKDPGENIVVGGANVWDCNSIVNYDFFPAIDSSPVGPILVYFKETQTNKESWSEGPGKLANADGKIKSGAAVPGQVHFFPAIGNSEQIRDEFQKRGCGKL